MYHSVLKRKDMFTAVFTAQIVAHMLDVPTYRIRCSGWYHPHTIYRIQDKSELDHKSELNITHVQVHQ